MINYSDIELAAKIISPYLHYTQIMKSDSLNAMLGHDLHFKAESLQKTGAFKVRGVLNCYLQEREKREINKIVCYSSGNHAQAVAYVAGEVGNIQAEIYMDKSCTLLKQNSAKKYGGRVILTDTRQEAESLSFAAGQEKGTLFIHPSDNDLVIAGAGTLVRETILEQNTEYDAIFLPIGGGGLISGSLIAAKTLLPNTKIIGGEPLIANDAYISRTQGKIFKFDQSPMTIADGLRTLALSKRTFSYIQNVDDIITPDEEDILFWTAWLNHLLKVACEPTSAVAMCAANQWLSKQNSLKKILVVISGGNVDQETLNKIWSEDRLKKSPTRITNSD